jgi:hypothetical protein
MIQESFIKPIKYGRLIEKSDKFYIYQPDTFDTLLSPYDGQIVDYQEIEIDGYNGFLRISHYINGKMYYSEFKGFGTVLNLPQRRTNVTQGQELTKVGVGNIKYELRDEDKNKVNISPFFGGIIKKDNEKSSNNKSSNNKSSNNNYVGLKDPRSDSSSLNDIPDLFTPFLLAPIGFVNKALNIFPKKNKKKDDEELNEEIKRIKELLK